jgi:hypothetical protein
LVFCAPDSLRADLRGALQAVTRVRVALVSMDDAADASSLERALGLLAQGARARLRVRAELAPLRGGVGGPLGAALGALRDAPALNGSSQCLARQVGGVALFVECLEGAPPAPCFVVARLDCVAPARDRAAASARAPQNASLLLSYSWSRIGVT